MVTATDNRKIASNTLVLYFRMLFKLLVTLYITRVITNVLGVSDYGIYGVVGGVVTVMMFLNNAMTTSTLRFITFALGTKDTDYLGRVYSAGIIIHIVLAIFVLIVGETLGLWYVMHQLNYPPERADAVFGVYQCSLISAMLMILNVPFNSTIIAHEKMTAFAVITILDITLQLLVVLLLPHIGTDHLLAYAFMLLIVQVIVRIIYVLYCRYKFRDVHFSIHVGKKVFVKMLKFAGWSTFGNMALVCNTQGLNLVLNAFGGVVVNAAREIAFQVQAAVVSFIASFQTAVNPQITKNYAQKDLQATNDLILRSSRLSFILLYLMALPIMTETEMILQLWLKVVPSYAPIFTRLLLCVAMVDSIANPMMIGASATGNIKEYHLKVGGILLCALPIAVLVLKLGFPIVSVFIVLILVVITAQIVRMHICRKLYHFSFQRFFNEVIKKLVVVVLISTILPVLLHFIVPEGFWYSFFVCAVAVLSVGVTSYFLGLTQTEQMFVKSKIPFLK